jgi:hypothetical protein
VTPERRAAVSGKAMSELSPDQEDDAREVWLRDVLNLQWKYYSHDVRFLLDRLDERDAQIEKLTSSSPRD